MIKALRHFSASNEGIYLQVMAVRSYSTPGREKEGKKEINVILYEVNWKIT